MEDRAFGWRELEDIVPQGDGALAVSLGSSPSARANAITNQQLRTQWETTFRRNTQRWTAYLQDAHTTSIRGSRRDGEEGARVRSIHRRAIVIPKKPTRRDDSASESDSDEEGEEEREEEEEEEEKEDEDERVRKWVPSATSGADLQRRLTMEETIEQLSAEVNRCVHKSAQQYRRNLVASAGDSFLPTIAALNAEELQQLLLQQHNDTTSNMQDKTQHGQPLQLRPLRSPKEVLEGRGRNSGSGKKGGSGSGRKTKAKAKTKATPGDDEGDGGSCGEGASGDDATAHETVVLRGEVPAANIYYFAKGNVKEGWLVKQGGRVQTWKKRYFILRPTKGVDDPGMLFYFERLPFKNSNTPAKGALLMREVISVDENDLPNKPLSFALCTFARKFWFQAATAEEKTEWTQAFSKFVLENLSSSLEQVDLTSSRSAQDTLYAIHDNRPSMLKPLIDREEAIYHRLSRAREEVASFPAHLFCFASGVTLVEGKEYLCLEDSLRNVKRPCVCRLRLGIKSRGDAVQDASLGFKFKQIKVYHRATEQYVKKSFPRKSGNKKAEKATKELLRFLYDGERIHYAVADVLLAKLSELIFWLEKDAKGEFLPFLLIKTTLLLSYDMAQPEAGETIQVKIVDLEHCKPKSAGSDVQSLSFLHGVRRLHKLLDRVYYEKSLADKVIKK